MKFQRTIAKSVSMTGGTLHNGTIVTLTMHAAPVDHGYKFRRIDLPDAPIIDALVDHVQTVERATTLVQGNAKIQTVEHVLSALAGLGVNNVLIEMDANEPPIGDGSAMPYVALIQEAGIVEQEATRALFEIHEPIHIETQGGSIMSIFPYEGFRISCTQAASDGKFTQYFSLEIIPETYVREIAPARTFVHYEDVKILMKKGLIKGGSLENALVIRGDSVLSKEPLRFFDEFVRHKILDIIGDIALAGRPLHGHIVAVKPGHGPNTELARAVIKSHRDLLAMAPKPMTSSSPVMDINAVKNALPHRYPFLMVDRVIEFHGTQKAVGVKCVTINEPFFQGHFPDCPIMPGVLQVEAMAQMASILMMRKVENFGKIGYFMSADQVKFRKPVFPGDTLFIHVEMLNTRKNIGKAACKCVVNGVIVSEGILLFGIMNQ